MSGTVIITKYSTANGSPATDALAVGEQAYSFNSDRLFIGETSGGNIVARVIGGQLFTDMMDHSAGTLTANSAIIVDASSKIDVLNIDNITIDANKISTTNANGDLTLDPHGTGSVVLDAATTISGDITHTGTQTTTGQLNVDNLTINDKTISVSQANNNLTLAANGTGKIIIDGTTVVVIPKGTEAQRPTAVAATDGALRYSTTNTRFEGVVDGSWISVGGVRDTDGDTYIEPELGADDDTLRFYIAGTEKAALNATQFQIDNHLEVDGSANIDGNTTIVGTLGVTAATTLTGNTGITGTLDVTGAVNFNNTTASSSKTTGAVIIDGGVGVAEDIYLGGQINATGDATFGGDLAVTGNTVLSGNLTVSGTTTTVDTTVTTLTDPVMHVGQGSLAAGDANDRGVSFEYGNGSVVKDGFFGMDIQTGKFVYQNDLTSAAADDDEFSSPWGDAQFGDIDADGNLVVDGASTLTGNTTVGGTLGVTGNTTIDGTLSSAGTFSVTTIGATGDLTIAPTGGDTFITGTLTTSGNLDVEGNVTFDNDVPVSSGGTGMSSFTSNGYFIANTGGTAVSFITGTQYDVLQFNSSGVPVASSTIDGGTF